MSEFETSQFSLAKLHQLSKDSQFPVAQRHFQRLYREVLNNDYSVANASFTIPEITTNEEIPIKIKSRSWKELESYCNLPIVDKEGNKYDLHSSKSDHPNGLLTIEFKSKHLITDARGETGEISGMLGFDKEGRLMAGYQNRFTPRDPKYSFMISYPEDGHPIIHGVCSPSDEDSRDMPMEDMPFFTVNESFLMVDVAEVMRRSL